MWRGSHPEQGLRVRQGYDLMGHVGPGRPGGRDGKMSNKNEGEFSLGCLFFGLVFLLAGLVLLLLAPSNSWGI